MKLPESYKPLQVVRETKKFWFLFIPLIISSVIFGATAAAIFGIASTITFLSEEKISPIASIILAAISLASFAAAVTFGIIDHNKPKRFRKEYDANNATWINSEFLPWVQNIVGFDTDYDWARKLLTNMEEKNSMRIATNSFVTNYSLVQDNKTKELSIAIQTQDREEWEEDLLKLMTPIENA